MYSDPAHGIIVGSGKQDLYRERPVFLLENIEFVPRRGTNCAKWDSLSARFSRDGLIGLWVADMDFRVAPCITEALRKAVDLGLFGYAYPSQGYYDAVIDWEERYHGYRIQKEWIRFSPGVVPAFNWLTLLFSEPGDGVLTLTPGYYPMLDAATKNGRRLVTSDLVLRDGQYVVDHEDFERKIAEGGVKVFLLCSPHNPLGRVFKPEELRRMLDICRRYKVFVVSDEIHQDIVFPGHTHHPTALCGEYDDMLATLIAPSKTFNLAGLQNAVMILPDENVRRAYDSFHAGARVSEGNTLGYIAAEAAYKGGRPWLDSVLAILTENERMVRTRLTEALPQLRIPELQGTYLMWLDFGKYLKPEEMTDFFEARCGIAMDYGSWFGGDPCCVRMNLATSGEVLADAVDIILREMKNIGRC